MNMSAIVREASQSEWGNTDFESRSLRNLLGSYPTGVAIVVTRTPDGRDVGLTINSFASLSLDPPLVLWSLVSHSPNLAVFRECEHFTISILSRQQQELAMRFASSSIENKFSTVPVHLTPEGISVIQGAIATLVCVNEQQSHIGDHLLMIGRVTRIGSEYGEPLVFHGGAFKELQIEKQAEERA